MRKYQACREGATKCWRSTARFQQMPFGHIAWYSLLTGLTGIIAFVLTIRVWQHTGSWWGVASFFIILIPIIWGGYMGHLPWVGVANYPKRTSLASPERGKTLWDWLQLLGIPTIVAVASFVLTVNQQASNDKQSQIASKQATAQAVIVNKQATVQAILAGRQATAQALVTEDQEHQALLDSWLTEFSGLVVNSANPAYSLQAIPPNKSIQALARARLLAILPELDPKRKAIVLHFLEDAQLIFDQAGYRAPDTFPPLLTPAPDATPGVVAAVVRRNYNPPLGLYGADFEGVVVPNINLRSALLDRVRFEDADLQGADLQYAVLCGSDLRGANLIGAKLQNAVLYGADLDNATLTHAHLDHAWIHWSDLKLKNGKERPPSLDAEDRAALAQDPNMGKDLPGLKSFGC